MARAHYVLLFDYKNLEVYDDQDRLIATYPASSGMEGTTPKDQHTPDVGPTPEGVYELNPREFREASLGLRLLQVVRDLDWKAPFSVDVAGFKVREGDTLGADFGDAQVRLSPVGDFTSRTGLLIHGGKWPGSRGCVDVGKNVLLLKGLLDEHVGDVRLVVDYSADRSLFNAELKRRAEQRPSWAAVTDGEGESEPVRPVGGWYRNGPAGGWHRSGPAGGWHGSDVRAHTPLSRSQPDGHRTVFSSGRQERAREQWGGEEAWRRGRSTPSERDGLTSRSYSAGGSVNTYRESLRLGRDESLKERDERVRRPVESPSDSHEPAEVVQLKAGSKVRSEDAPVRMKSKD